MVPVFALDNAVAYCRLIVCVPPPVDNIDVSSTANLYKSLAQAAPEIKQCVDACNFIAESTRQQNDIGSVSVTHYLPSQQFVGIFNVLDVSTYYICLYFSRQVVILVSFYLKSLLFCLKEIESWVLIGKMIDKVCFWAAILLFIFGTVGIFLTGHFNQAPEFPFPGENKKYVPS